MKTRLHPRGAAAVEMAITMVVLIPLIFFAIFLQDFVYYRLNGQEPLVGAQWDHVTPDYMKNKPDVGGMNRLKYCDHTAAYDSYNRDFDCAGAPGGADEADTGDGDGASASGGSAGVGHHHAVGAHQCWLGGGKQIRCGIDTNAGIQLNAGTAMQEYHVSPWNKGGLATCTAALNVFNFIIPQQKDGWLWSKKKATNRTQFGKAGGGDREGEKKWAKEGDYTIDNAHKDGASTNATDNQGDGDAQMGSWLMSTESMAMFVDPWALTTFKDVMPLEGAPATDSAQPGKVPGTDTYNPLLDRTGHYYMKYGNDALGKADSWHGDMKDYLSSDSQSDGKGDHLRSVPVTWSKDIGRPGYKCCNGSGKTDPARPNEFPKGWGPQ